MGEFQIDPLRPVLSVRGLSKAFGNIAVTRAVDLDLVAGARMGLIGPNGAGKTTLINLLTGVLAPDAGKILLQGQPLNGLTPERRVHRGLVRTHQINMLLLEDTARDNVAIAIAERERIAWRMFRYGPAWTRCRNEADSRLADLGIAHLRDRTVAELAYGPQRLLEIAAALALCPKVLLLDEPAAGVPSTETHLIHDALDRLPPDMSILIIEHDMDIIFRFAREITVLVQGGVLTRGSPAEIAANAEVRAVYLGRGH